MVYVMFCVLIVPIAENLCMNVDKSMHFLGRKASYVTNKTPKIRVYTLMQTIA